MTQPQPQPIRYQRTSYLVENMYTDLETGIAFIPSDSPEYNAFLTWVADGNVPNDVPINQKPKGEDTVSRPARIGKLSRAAKQALADAGLNTPGEKALARIFGEALEALAALDAPSPDHVMRIPEPVELQRVAEPKKARQQARVGLK